MNKTIDIKVNSIRSIDGQLWCCCEGAKIVVFDNDLEILQTVVHSGMKRIYDVFKMPRFRFIIIASSCGLLALGALGEDNLFRCL